MNSDTNDRTSDRRVSETYRSVATERTPAHLDREVLRMARREGRTPYAAARAWMRPITWAATIAICFAFVMQLTQLPREAVELDAPAPPPQVPAADSPPPLSAEQEAADPIRPQAEAPVAAPGKEQATEAWRTADRLATAGKAMSVSQEPARADKPGAMSPAAGPAGASDEPASPRRERVAVSAVAELAAAESQSLAAGIADDAEPLCAAEVRESAARWHACIESLRDSVAEDRLAREIADFDAAYPDYDPETRLGR